MIARQSERIFWAKPGKHHESNCRAHMSRSGVNYFMAFIITSRPVAFRSAANVFYFGRGIVGKISSLCAKPKDNRKNRLRIIPEAAPFACRWFVPNSHNERTVKANKRNVRNRLEIRFALNPRLRLGSAGD